MKFVYKYEILCFRKGKLKKTVVRKTLDGERKALSSLMRSLLYDEFEIDERDDNDILLRITTVVLDSVNYITKKRSISVGGSNA